MYSASVDERAIVFCVRDVQAMRPPASFRKNPVWDRHPSGLLAQLESVHAESPSPVALS